MEKIIDKKWYQLSITLFIILLISIFFSSCNKKLQTNNTVEAINSTNDSILDNNNTAQFFNLSSKKDPLFFIDGQLCQHLREIHQDKNGNLWFGTNVYDLMRYNGDTLEYFSKTDGIGGGRITAIVEDKKGNVWFGTYGGLTKFDGEKFSNINIKNGSIDNDIWSLTIDQKGKIWIGTSEGVIQFNGEELIPFPIPKAEVKESTTIYSYNRVTCILEDRHGVLWFGTDGFGISKYDGKSFTHITKENGLPDNNISDIMEDKNGNIWIGTMFGGISRYDGKTFTNFTKEGVIKGVEVGGLYEDKTGNIWFAAENHGVYRFNGKSFTNFHTKEGLITNGILCIFEDNEDRFWFGGWGGLFLYNGESFLNVTKDGPWSNKLWFE